MDNWITLDDVNETRNRSFVANIRDKKMYDLENREDVQALVAMINAIEHLSDMHLEMAQNPLRLFKYTNAPNQTWSLFWAKDMDDAWSMNQSERGSEGVSIGEIKPKRGESFKRGGW